MASRVDAGGGVWLGTNLKKAARIPEKRSRQFSRKGLEVDLHTWPEAVRALEVFLFLA